MVEYLPKGRWKAQDAWRQALQHTSQRRSAFAERMRGKPVKQEPALYRGSAVDQRWCKERQLERGRVGLPVGGQRSVH